MSQSGSLNPASSGGNPVNPANGGTGVSSPPAHTVPIAEGAAPFNFVGPGTAGQVFTSNGAGVDPSFQAAGGGGGAPPFPSNPCASVGLSGGLSNVTGDGSLINPVIFNFAFFDQAANYNTATGLFTAPTTGKYLITANLTFSNLTLAHTSGWIRIVANGSTWQNNFNPGVSADVNGTYTASISGIFVLPVGSTASILAIVAGSTKTVGLLAPFFNSVNNAFFELLT